MRSVLQTLDTIVRSLISLAIIGIGMNAQAALTVMPPFLALCCGIVGFVWVVPTFWTCCVFGIVGTPSSWKRLLQSIFLEKKNATTDFGVSSLVSGFTTLWQALVFRPFQCPRALRSFLPKGLIPICFREDPVLIPPVTTSSTAAVHNKEYWIFVNGVGTNQTMAQQSQAKLQQVFKRPCWLYYIPTNSIWLDVLYTFVSERMGWTTSQPLLFHALHNAIVQAAAGRYERVVLVTHGTVVMATLQELHDMDPHFSHLMKRFLEVYTFGHAGHSIPRVGAYLEHLVNGRDALAWQGVLFPYRRFWRNARGEAMQINGRVCKEPEQWGHLFAAHYLEPMIQNGAFRSSRLHLFRNGQVGTRVSQLKSAI